MRKPSYLFIACLSVLFILSPGKSDSANFTVSPIRLFFDGQKTNAIQVTNNSDEKLSLELSVYAWAEDEDAKDVFSPTQDIIFFPRMLTLSKGEERLVRVGLRAASGDKEKTYRIYFEEMPGPSPQEGATVRTLMRAGVPIFVAPRKAGAAGAIEGAAF
ncbi:MAG: molecular chaperone, partial [Deltaproteobacteria bacterium]|nr:molecular chaperone [Deltaproteobacteria bacterium]